MITENLSTLKIHKLTQEQYDREFEVGNIDANALYLTPDETDQTYNAKSSNAQSGTAVAEALNNLIEYGTQEEFDALDPAGSAAPKFFVVI